MSLFPRHEGHMDMSEGSSSASTDSHGMDSPHSMMMAMVFPDPICPSSPTEALGQVDGAGEKRKRLDHCQVVRKRRRGLIDEDLTPPPLQFPGRSFHMSRDGDVQMVEARSDTREGLDDRRRATLVGVRYQWLILLEAC